MTVAGVAENLASAAPHRVVVTSSFDVAEAARVAHVIGEHAGVREVEIDFSRAQHVQDYALALLLHALRRFPSARIRARGLCQHAARLLSYLGVDPETLAPLPRAPRGERGRA